MTCNKVYIFHADNARFSGGVFTTLESADKWICENNLFGVLTVYPLDTGVYEWAIKNGKFTPTKDEHKEPSFIGGFTSAYQEHYHYENETGS
ncbi:MAG: hypothetical protein RPS47_17165 [Colwellia sp.]|jgi:hypothetical protein